MPCWQVVALCAEHTHIQLSQNVQQAEGAQYAANSVNKNVIRAGELHAAPLRQFGWHKHAANAEVVSILSKVYCACKQRNAKVAGRKGEMEKSSYKQYMRGLGNNEREEKKEKSGRSSRWCHGDGAEERCSLQRVQSFREKMHRLLAAQPEHRVP